MRPLSFVAMVLATCCAPAPSQSAGATAGDWTTLATAARQTPARGAGLQRRWTGADGQAVTLAVIAPQLGGHPVVTLQPAAGDNGPAIRAALARLRAAGGGTLRLAAGRYPIAGGPPAVAIDGLTDVLVDGPGARLVFANWGDGILISNSARVAIHGLTVGYAQPAMVAARVRGGALAFTGAAPAAGASVYQVTGLGTSGRRVLLGKQGDPLAAAASGRMALPAAALDGFADGDAVQVKLAYYRGAAIRIADPGDRPVSHDITLDDVTVHDSAGGGVVADYMGRGLAVVNSHFGAGADAGNDDPGGIAYDALHVTAATGDILVENNSFTGSGDDAINLASPIFDASAAGGGRTATIGGKAARVYPGARIAFFDAALQLLGTAQVTARAPRDAAGRMTTSFATPIPGGAIRYARNMDLLGTRYAIVGNQIADCVCHGILVQNPDGLVRDNRFAGLRYNAIRIVTSAAWMEGAGAQDVVIADNHIAQTGDDDRRGMVWAAITAFGELAPDGAAQAPVAAAPLHADLLIRGNRIANVGQGCVSISSATDVTLRDNDCTGFNRQLAREPMLLERADVAAGVRRLPAKGAYLARGDGVWIDPLSTARVSQGAATP